jgi:superfamily II DNA or RNA helicase
MTKPKVFIRGMAWRDMSTLTEGQRANLRVALTVQPKKTSEHDTEMPPPIEMYEEDEERGLFGMPREFYFEKSSGKCEDVVEVAEGYPLGDFESKIRHDGRYAEQRVIVDTILGKLRKRPWGGAILQAPCGAGKTVSGLSIAYSLGVRTLILVHKEFLMDQWAERIREFLPGARVGFIRQERCEFKNVDFAIGMMGSLASRHEKYPAEMYSAFGTMLIDECHRASAHTWSQIPPRFAAKYIIGLSATPNRPDGTERVFHWSIGKVGYVAQVESLVPRIRRVYSEMRLKGKMDRYGKIRDASRLGHTEMVTQVCEAKERVREITDDLAKAVQRGRKIIVMGERLEHLKMMGEDLKLVLRGYDVPFPVTIDYFTGEWFTGETDGKGRPKRRRRTKAELKKAESANVIFATNQLVSEGLDVQALDVLFFATPVSDIEQIVGRVRRACDPKPEKCSQLCPWRAGQCEGKPHPIVADLIDRNVPVAVKRWQKRLKFYESIGAK